MKFLLRVSVFAAMLTMIMPAMSAQDVSKEEEKFWKKKAKTYVKNPLALKSEFENYQDQIKDLKARNKELLNRSAGSTANDEIDSLRWANIQLEGELQALQSQYDQLRTEYQSRRKVGDMGIQPGLVFRVQIGAYIFHEMENTPQGAGDFVHEQSDGYNKYVIGNFRTYNECESFKYELVSMGISDAWIVPYYDGERITIHEANRILQEQGQPMIVNN